MLSPTDVSPAPPPSSSSSNEQAIHHNYRSFQRILCPFCFSSFFRILFHLASAVSLWPRGDGSRSPPAVPFSRVYLNHTRLDTWLTLHQFSILTSQCCITTPSWARWSSSGCCADWPADLVFVSTSSRLFFLDLLTQWSQECRISFVLISINYF